MSRGFILAEASLTFLILGFAVVAVVPLFLLCVRGNQATARIAAATHLATELLEEVRLRRWDESTPTPPEGISMGSSTLGVDAGESAADKRTFDDIDDFNGWTEPAAPGPLDPVMRPLTALSGYSRSVTVRYLNASFAASATPTDYKGITVCVTGARMKPVCLEGLATNR